MNRLAIATVIVVTLIAAAPSVPQGLLVNPGFADALEGWTTDDAEGIYSVDDADGYSDNTSLRYQVAAETDGGPVVQSFACVLNTDYVLTIALKSDGRINPLVRVVEPGADRVLAGVMTRGQTTWTLYTERFNSGPATELRVQVFGDSALSNNGKAGAGTTAVDDLQVYPAAELPADLRPADLYLPPGPNIALNAAYEYTPRAKYPYSYDEGDATQLTDGLLTVGYFWTQKSTVGWMRTGPVSLTVDLGQDQPIAGLSFRSAAGVAGVTWPNCIHVFTSDDEKQWYLAGDLVVMSDREIGPPAGGYRTHRFAVSELNTHGRYVRLIISYFPFAFCDEVEVYRGADELLARAPVGEQMSGTTEFIKEAVVVGAIAWRLRTDLADARKAIEAAQLPDADRATLLVRTDELALAIESLPPTVPEGFQTILPFSNLHANIYALNAAVLRSQGLNGLVAWACNRYDPLAPTQGPDVPPEGAPALRVDMISGEYRAEVFNLSNATDNPIAATVSVTGLPGGDNPDWVTVREVLFTDTRTRSPIAAALPDAEPVAGGFAIDIPAGMTRQVWLAFRPTDVPAGEHVGQVTVTASGQADIAMPLTVKVYPFAFPDRPTLSLGGWDYMDGGGMYGITPANMTPVIEALREYYVDTPWATRGTQPSGGEYDADGRLTNELDFELWDRWIGRWPDARNYAVFLRVGDHFRDEPQGTPRFDRMVGEWITAWVEHMADQGLEAGRLMLLTVDEPTKPEQTVTMIAWGRAIRASQPGVTLFEDTRFKEPWNENPELFELCDVLCPNAYILDRCPERERQFYLDQQAAGRKLWLYQCSGPGKGLDPYAYHRGEPWQAIRYGALGCGYWAFGSSGGSGATSWNAYAQSEMEYSPLFIGADSVTNGKHMEGIREGVQDYEYFVMLRARIAELKAAGVNAPALTRAEALLADGPLRVTTPIAAEGIGWGADRDRTLMDQVRVEVLDALVALADL